MFAVGVSIGIVEITQATSAVADVMSAADVACYSAKDRGRNRVQLYKLDDVPERHREMHWVSRLTCACDESRFELYFQPMVPSEFIPAAQRYNVMPSIDRWVMRQAVDHVVHQIGSVVKPYTAAVNLSGVSLNDERSVRLVRRWEFIRLQSVSNRLKC